MRASSFSASTAVSSSSSVVIAGKRVEWRAHNEPMEGSYFCAPSEKISPTDRLIKRIEMTKDLCDLIVFMVNSYIRPTDIRNMQHKHVEVIKLEIVLEVTGLKLSTAEETLTLYSLQHISIMFRLMFGRGVDTLSLARNARTSHEMIDRFYTAPLQGEMNVGKLQSKRRLRPWEY